jgi:hypothetical protein
MFVDEGCPIWERNRSRIYLLMEHLDQLQFYLYNYDFDKMPNALKSRFKCINKFSELLKANKI